MPDPDHFEPGDKLLRGGIGGGRMPPGGPGIGPGGGFGTNPGTAFGQNLAPFSSGLGMGIRAKRKVVQGPNGPIPIAFSPMTAQQQDTVPAMLSPGEFVVNNRATQMPGVLQQLQAVNQMGNAQHFAAGGQVQPEMGGMDDMGDMMGGMNPDHEMLRNMLLRLLPLLLGMDGSEAMGAEQHPQHFAFGGQVRQRGGFAQPGAQMAPSAPQMPQAGLQTASGVPRQGAQSAGVGTALGRSGMFGRPGGAGTIVGGGTQGGAQPLGNPQLGGEGWGWNPQNIPGIMNIGDNPLYQRMTDMLKQFGGAGAFGPEGNPQLLASLQGEATQNADALRKRAGTLADMQGLDAGQRGSYAMQTDLNTQGGVANTLNSAKLGLLQNQQQFGQNLLNSMGGTNQADYLARLAYEHQRLLGK